LFKVTAWQGKIEAGSNRRNRDIRKNAVGRLLLSDPKLNCLISANIPLLIFIASILWVITTFSVHFSEVKWIPLMV
jgi:hypothetical protein